jgi:hypothetical protein
VIGLILDQSVSVAEFERRIILGVSRVLYNTAHQEIEWVILRDKRV